MLRGGMICWPDQITITSGDAINGVSHILHLIKTMQKTTFYRTELKFRQVSVRQPTKQDHKVVERGRYLHSFRSFDYQGFDRLDDQSLQLKFRIL